jgi:hypothetical protein
MSTPVPASCKTRRARRDLVTEWKTRLKSADASLLLNSQGADPDDVATMVAYREHCRAKVKYHKTWGKRCREGARL